jgi:ABC-type lipoprotein export system ATPase subunit
MIYTQNLSYTYAGGKEIAFPDMKCNTKEILLILGKSGVGKTTLLHLLSGLLSIQKGEIDVDGTKLSTLSGSTLDNFRGKNIGIVFQQNHFIESIPVIENITLAQRLGGLKIDKDKAFEILGRLNIADKASKSVKNLSQGEKQRVAIARALINKPKLILADEPTSALDDNNAMEVIKLLKEQTIQSEAALIIVTHDTRLKDIFTNQVILS